MKTTLLILGSLVVAAHAGVKCKPDDACRASALLDTCTESTCWQSCLNAPSGSNASVLDAYLEINEMVKLARDMKDTFRTAGIQFLYDQSAADDGIKRYQRSLAQVLALALPVSNECNPFTLATFSQQSAERRQLMECETGCRVATVLDALKFKDQLNGGLNQANRVDRIKQGCETGHSQCRNVKTLTDPPSCMEVLWKRAACTQRLLVAFQNRPGYGSNTEKNAIRSCISENFSAAVLVQIGKNSNALSQFENLIVDTKIINVRTLVEEPKTTVAEDVAACIRNSCCNAQG